MFIVTYLLTYLLTPRSRVLEKLTGSKLVKKFPAFYGTRRFITSFTSDRHLSLSWASSMQSMPVYPTSLRSILILSSLYACVFQVVSFPQAWRHIGGSNGIPTLTLNFGTRCRWVVKSKLRSLAGENTCTHWTGPPPSLLFNGYRCFLDVLGKEKIPCRDSNTEMSSPYLTQHTLRYPGPF